MTLLVCVNIEDWLQDEEVRDILQPFMPDIEIAVGRPDTPRDDIVMLACTVFRDDLMPQIPNLQLVQKLGAGVESMVGNPALPQHVRVARLSSAAQSREIAEYCLAYVLRFQRNMDFHDANQRAAQWAQRAPRLNKDTTVGVLGLGTIGGTTARLFAEFGFRVLGWSRSPKAIDGVDCRHGMDALPDMLGDCDYVAAILPQTPETVGLFDATMLSKMKPGAVLMNAGRGTLIVDDALVAALDKGQLGGAVLDVFNGEPIPTSHPFWAHPKVIVTPHVSGWTVDDCWGDIAENYRRLVAGDALLNEVDRKTGY